GQREALQQAIRDLARILPVPQLAISTRFSRPVRISSTAANCRVRLIDSRTFAGSLATSRPSTLAVPASALSSVDRILTTVVLPSTVGAEQGEDTAPCHLEVHPAQHVQLRVGLL